MSVLEIYALRFCIYLKRHVLTSSFSVKPDLLSSNFVKMWLFFKRVFRTLSIAHDGA